MSSSAGSDVNGFSQKLDGVRSYLRSFLKRNYLTLVTIGLLSFLLVIFLFDRIFVSVHSGQNGVLWRRFGEGTVIETVYSEGLHIVMPFNRMYIYNTRKQLLSDSINVLTLDGLTVRVKYSVRYHLQNSTLPLLHKKIGPDFVNVLVRPDVRSVVRDLFGQYRPEVIYNSQRAIQTLVTTRSKERLIANFISIDDVPIELVTLPTEISKAIESKMIEQQNEASYVYRLAIAKKEAERLDIESAGIRNYHEKVNAGLSTLVLKWEGIQATRDLAKSKNSKVIVIGSSKSGLPVILGNE